MSPRAPIISGKTVILLQVQDTVDSALAGVRKKLNKFSASLSNISLDLFRGGIVSTLPLIGILNEFKRFEDRILFLRTKVETSDEAFAGLEQTIRDLGRTTSFTAQEVADGATSLAQAGLSLVQIQNTLQAVLDLARGSEISLSDSAMILANTMAVFSIESEKANEVASQFIVAARKGTLDVLNLKESLKEVVGTLAVLNIDLPTSLALVTQLAQSSLKGTKAGTSLNTALLNLAKNSDVLKNTLGINTTDTAGNLRPFIDILDELNAKLASLGNARRVAVIQRLFNIRGGRAITGLIRDLDRIRELEVAIRGAGNEAREAAVKMDSGLGGALRIAASAAQDLAISIGKINSGPLIDILRVVPALLNSFDEIVRTNPKLVLTIAAIPPAMLAAGVAGLSFAFVLSKVAAVVGTVGAGITGLGSIINQLFTGQLILALRTLSAFRSGINKLDSGIATRVLGPTDPARVIAAEKRVAAARTALRRAQLGASASLEIKAQKKLNVALGRLRSASSGGSFLSRVGATKVSGSAVIAPIVAAFKSIPSINLAALFGQALSTSNSIFTSITTSIEKSLLNFQKLGSRVNYFNATLTSGKLLLTQQVAEVNKLKKAIDAVTVQPISFTLANSFNDAVSAVGKTRFQIAATTKEISVLNRAINSASTLDVAGDLAKVSRLEAISAKIAARNETNARRVANFEKSIAGLRQEAVTLNLQRNAAAELAAKGSVAARQRELALVHLIERNELQQFKIRKEIQKLPQRAVLITSAEAGRQRAAIAAKAAAEAERVVQLKALRDTAVARRAALAAQIPAELAQVKKLATAKQTAEVAAIAAAESKKFKLTTALFAKERKLANTAGGINASKTILSDLKGSGIAGFLGRVSSLIKTAGLGALNITAKGLSATFRGLATGGLRAFVAAWNLIKKIDIVKILFNVAVMAKNLTLVFTRLGVVAFRTLTTLSGWGNIITVLLLVGPHIEFVRKAFERLGKGFSDAFGTIFGTFRDAAPAFALFATGIRSIFSGEGEQGVKQLGNAIISLATIIKSNLKIAFDQIVIAFAPAYDFLRRGISSIIELFKLLGSIVGLTFSNIGEGINNLSGGGAGSIIGSITSTIKEAFSPESIKAAFSFVGLVFIKIAESVNSILEKIFTVVSIVMGNISRALEGLFSTILSLLLNLSNSLAGGPFDGIALGLAATAGDVVEPLRNSLRESGQKQDETVEKMGAIFGTVTVKLEGIFDKFLINLDSIFNKDTEGDAQADKAAAELAKKRAQEFAERQAQGQPGNPFFKAGQFLGNPTPAITGLVNKAKEALGFGPKKEGSFVGFFSEVGKKLTAEFQERVKGLNKIKQTPQAIQADNLANIFAATVGSIQSTRLNKFKVGADDKTARTNDLLEGISKQLGPGTETDSYLKQLTDRAGPLVLQ